MNCWRNFAKKPNFIFDIKIRIDFFWIDWDFHFLRCSTCFFKTPFFFFYSCYLIKSLYFMIDNNINNEESIFIVQNPPPPKKISTLSLYLLGSYQFEGIRIKWRWEKQGESVCTICHIPKKISVAFHNFLSPHYLVYTATV